MEKTTKNGQTGHSGSPADCKPVASGCSGSTPLLSTNRLRGTALVKPRPEYTFSGTPTRRIWTSNFPHKSGESCYNDHIK
jgi:hypothetical protein